MFILIVYKTSLDINEKILISNILVMEKAKLPSECEAFLERHVFVSRKHEMFYTLG